MNIAYLKRKSLKKETYIKSPHNRKLKMRRRTMSPFEKKQYLYLKFFKFKQLVHSKLRDKHSSHYILFNNEHSFTNGHIKITPLNRPPTFYEKYKINSLISNRTIHYNCLYKDEKIFNNDEEFLKKYFPLRTTFSLIQSETQIETRCIPTLFPHGTSINTYLDKHNEHIIKRNEMLIKMKRKGKYINRNNIRNEKRRFTLKELMKICSDSDNHNKFKQSAIHDSFCSSVHDSIYLKSLMLTKSDTETVLSNSKRNLKLNIVSTEGSFTNDNSIEPIENLIKHIQHLDKNAASLNQKQTIISKQTLNLSNSPDKLMITSLKHQPQINQHDITTQTKQPKQSAKTSRFQSPTQSFKYTPYTPLSESVITNSKYKTIDDFITIQRYNDKNCFRKENALSSIAHMCMNGINKNYIKKTLREQIPLKNKRLLHKIIHSNYSLSNTDKINNKSDIDLTKENKKRKSDIIGERLYNAVTTRHLSRKGELLTKRYLDLELAAQSELLLKKTKKRLLKEDMKFNRSNSFRTMIKIPFLYKQSPQ